MKIREYNSKENSEMKFKNNMLRKFQKQKFNENSEINIQETSEPKVSMKIPPKRIVENSEPKYF
jgi:hypothetical protein